MVFLAVPLSPSSVDRKTDVWSRWLGRSTFDRDRQMSKNPFPDFFQRGLNVGGTCFGRLEATPRSERCS